MGALAYNTGSRMAQAGNTGTFDTMKNKLSTNELWRFLMVAAGTVLFSAAINLFLTPLKLYNGGALGI